MDKVDSIFNVEVREGEPEYEENWRVKDWIEERKKKGGSPGGDTYAFTSWEEGNRFWIGWWHPKTISGSRTFKIKYTVSGGIGIYEQGDELYWKAIFKDRDVSVRTGKVTVHFPIRLSSENLEIETYGITAENSIVNDRTIEFVTGRIPP